MNTKTAVIIAAIILVIAGGAYWLHGKGTAPAAPATGAETPVSKPGLYVDSAFGFSFAYPLGTKLTEANLSDTSEFPGATAVKSIQVGAPGDVVVYEVSSPNAVITDEPNNHASPIGQTKYFYDSATNSWMVAYPEGGDGGPSATTTATVMGQTSGGLSILPSGRRFDTRIIPLSPT